jgi:hypothetical protein
MKTTYVYIGLVTLVIIGLIVVRNSTDGGATSGKATPYDSFAQCLTDAGAKFYGAYWCPHCQSQKELFKNSSKLPYIECSTPNGQGQLPICTEAGITGYPTWKFADGSQLDGERTLKELGEKTNCVVPTI